MKSTESAWFIPSKDEGGVADAAGGAAPARGGGGVRCDRRRSAGRRAATGAQYEPGTRKTGSESARARAGA